MILRRIILVSSLALTQAAQASDCRQQGFASATERVPPLANFANQMVQADIDTAAGLADPIAAIAKLQENQYTMWHPKIDRGQPAGYYRVRCADSALYIALNDAIVKRVQTLVEPYRAKRQFLGTSRQQTQANTAVTGEAGLLNLLLLGNLNEAFEQEATTFLRNAIGDSQARGYFSEIYTIVDARLRHIEEFNGAYNAEYAKPVSQLLPIEQQATSKLAGLAGRLDPIRIEHTNFWLAKEKESYQQILAQKPMELGLLTGGMELATAREQLELAIGVALPKNQTAVRQHAEARGDSLVALNRHREATTYYKVARSLPGVSDKLENAQAVIDAADQERIATIQERAKLDIESMKKTDQEKQSFEDDTDALADELGIDLDDF